MFPSIRFVLDERYRMKSRRVGHFYQERNENSIWLFQSGLIKVLLTAFKIGSSFPESTPHWLQRAQIRSYQFCNNVKKVSLALEIYILVFKIRIWNIGSGYCTVFPSDFEKGTPKFSTGNVFYTLGLVQCTPSTKR